MARVQARSGMRAGGRIGCGRDRADQGFYFAARDSPGAEKHGLRSGQRQDRGFDTHLAGATVEDIVDVAVQAALDEYTPEHSTISRTRRLIDLDTHREVFSWVLGVLADRGQLKGQRIAIDATTLEANAAMRSIVRRDTGESYEELISVQFATSDCAISIEATWTMRGLVPGLRLTE